MRVHFQPAAKAVAPAATPQKTHQTGARFVLPDEAQDIRQRAAPTRAQSAAQAAGLETLLAVQNTQGDQKKDRRRKGMQRGRQSLDLLDSLKVTLLEGMPSPATLLRLKGVVSEPRLPTDDAGLDDVLDAIDLRAQVELAKFEARKPL